MHDEMTKSWYNDVSGLASALTRKQEAAEQSRRKTSSTVSLKRPHAEEVYDDDDEQEELSDQCPEADGYFPSADQCDKYYDCRDGKFTEKLCPDGLVFNDFSPQQEKCDLPLNIDCSKRPKLRKTNEYYDCILIAHYSLSIYYIQVVLLVVVNWVLQLKWRINNCLLELCINCLTIIWCHFSSIHNYYSLTNGILMFSSAIAIVDYHNHCILLLKIAIIIFNIIYIHYYD